MKRIILFRGKRKDKDQWLYGAFLQHIKTYIYWGAVNDRPLLTEVDPETVGQYTGLQDRDGKGIYEGDIVQHDAWNYPFKVIFNQEKSRFVCEMKTRLTYYIDNERMKVIGNIHDNPEMIQ